MRVFAPPDYVGVPNHTYGWGNLVPTGKNPRRQPWLFSTTSRNFKSLLQQARADAIVGACNAIIKKKRDVEGESRGGSWGSLYEQHQIMSSSPVM